MIIPQQKIFKFVQKLNQNDEYTKLTQTQKQIFQEQFQELQQDEKQAWLEFSINEIFGILIEGHIHKAQTYFIFLIEVTKHNSLDISEFHQQLQDLLEKCFMDEKKLKKREFQEFEHIFKSIGITSGINITKASLQGCVLVFRGDDLGFRIENNLDKKSNLSGQQDLLLWKRQISNSTEEMKILPW